MKAARFFGSASRPTASHRILRTSSSIERPLPAALVRSRVFTSSSRFRIVMLAKSMSSAQVRSEPYALIATQSIRGLHPVSLRSARPALCKSLINVSHWPGSFVCFACRRCSATPACLAAEACIGRRWIGCFRLGPALAGRNGRTRAPRQPAWDRSEGSRCSLQFPFPISLTEPPFDDLFHDVHGQSARNSCRGRREGTPSRRKPS